MLQDILLPKTGETETFCKAFCRLQRQLPSLFGFALLGDTGPWDPFGTTREIDHTIGWFQSKPLWFLSYWDILRFMIILMDNENIQYWWVQCSSRCGSFFSPFLFFAFGSYSWEIPPSQRFFQAQVKVTLFHRPLLVGVKVKYRCKKLKNKPCRKTSRAFWKFQTAGFSWGLPAHGLQ